jgi:GABA(A) receptor-associated protein
MDFREKHSKADRLAESGRISERYPERIPAIVYRKKNSDISDIDKNKFLIPKDMTLGQFVYVIRRRLRLKPEKAIFVFVNNTLPPVSVLMSQLYGEQKDEDGFLYIEYATESTFG